MDHRLFTCVVALASLAGCAADRRAATPAVTRPADAFRVLSSAVSLTVDDVPASSRFLVEHFGFHERMAADGFASLARDDGAVDVIFLRRGIETLPPAIRDVRQAGVIVAFVVGDAAAQEARLKREGVTITLPLKDEPWGERLFQVTDPNGVVVEVVEWLTPAGR